LLLLRLALPLGLELLLLRLGVQRLALLEALLLDQDCLRLNY
jgi:hypothetical protein